MMLHSEKLGFLNLPNALRFEGGRIEPLDNFDEQIEYVKSISNRDGYCYPPPAKSVELDPTSMEQVKDIPNTDRPAAVFSMPVSHELFVDDPLDGDNLRREDAALLIHLIAFLYGTRLQFSGWRFDGRVPIRSTMDIILSDATASNFISHVYQRWRSWTDKQRFRFINILYMKQKAHSCEWEWDAFLYQYIVLDAIYQFHVLSGNPSESRHRDRILSLCSHYSMNHEAERIEKITTLRNSLFHEALWDGDTPGFGSSRSFHEHIWLEKLNSRLIVAITGYKNEFSRTAWWTFGTRIFDNFKGNKLVDSQT